MWLITMVIVSPLSVGLFPFQIIPNKNKQKYKKKTLFVSLLTGVVPLPNGLFFWANYKWGLPTTYKSWDDPPSGDGRDPQRLMGFQSAFGSRLSSLEIPSHQVSHEKNPVDFDFPLYWLFNRDPYNGLL